MIASLMAEYRRATANLCDIIQNVSNEEFRVIKDELTSNKDCESIQSLSFHIIHSGYTYANYFFSLTSNEWHEYDKEITNPTIAIEELKMMLDYTEKSVFELSL